MKPADESICSFCTFSGQLSSFFQNPLLLFVIFSNLHDADLSVQIERRLIFRNSQRKTTPWHYVPLTLILNCGEISLCPYIFHVLAGEGEDGAGGIDAEKDHSWR